jgi:small subunit ribosomal protein S12
MVRITYFKKLRLKKKNLSRTFKLNKGPQIKGITAKVFTTTPKKPNSALRHIAKLKLHTIKNIRVRLPGRGYLPGKFARMLIRGGRANDLPGVGYTAIRGIYDFSSLYGKKKRRSIYGVNRPKGYTTHVRRCFRKYVKP